MVDEFTTRKKSLLRSWWFYLIICGCLIVIVLLAAIGWLGFKVFQGVQNKFLTASQERIASLAASLDTNASAQQAQQATAMDNQSAVKIYEVTAGSAPSLGPAKAKIQLIAFEDFQCPYCQAEQAVLKQLLEFYPNDIHFAYKHFPSASHAAAQSAAEASLCAQEQDKFWPFHDLLFQYQENLGSERLVTLAQEAGLNLTSWQQCLATNKYRYQVLQDYSEAQELGLAGTPTFFLNGQKLVGAVPLETFKKIIAAHLLLLRPSK